MSRTVKRGDYWENVEFQTSNIIVQKVRDDSEGDILFIIGNGHSLELDENDFVIKKDPGMHEFYPNIEIAGVTIYTFYYVTAIASLLKAGEDLAGFINKINANNRFKKVILIGHSKSGLTVAEACNHTNKVVNVCVTISTPFDGTVTADIEEFKKRVNPLIGYGYSKIFSNHRVDREIIPNSEITMRPRKTIVCWKHLNIVSVLEFKKALFNLVDLACLYLDRCAGIEGDGIVPVDSQINNTASIQNTVYCSHARSLNIGLKIVEDIIKKE